MKEENENRFGGVTNKKTKLYSKKADTQIDEFIITGLDFLNLLCLKEGYVKTNTFTKQ